MMTVCPMCEPFPHIVGAHFVVCEEHRRRLEEAPMLSPTRTYAIPGYTVIDVRPCEEHGFDCPDGPECWTCCECDARLDDSGGCPNPDCCEWVGLSQG